MKHRNMQYAKNIIVQGFHRSKMRYHTQFLFFSFSVSLALSSPFAILVLHCLFVHFYGWAPTMSKFNHFLWLSFRIWTDQLSIEPTNRHSFMCINNHIKQCFECEIENPKRLIFTFFFCCLFHFNNNNDVLRHSSTRNSVRSVKWREKHSIYSIFNPLVFVWKHESEEEKIDTFCLVESDMRLFYDHCLHSSKMPMCSVFGVRFLCRFFPSVIK